MNDALAQLFSSGRIIDIVVLITALEGLALAAYHASTGKGVTPRDYALNMTAGLFLMVALRFALVGSTWLPVALCLTASGAFHGLDMATRWRRTGRQLDVQ